MATNANSTTRRAFLSVVPAVAAMAVTPAVAAIPTDQAATLRVRLAAAIAHRAAVSEAQDELEARCLAIHQGMWGFAPEPNGEAAEHWHDELRKLETEYGYPAAEAAYEAADNNVVTAARALLEVPVRTLDDVRDRLALVSELECNEVVAALAWSLLPEDHPINRAEVELY